MLISIKNINKRYGEVQALKDITFDNLTSGNCLGILGKNGAGKTTLFNILADLVEPDMGYILINDAQITPSEKKWKQQIGIASDEIPLIEDFTGAEFLKFTGLLYNLSLMEVKQRSSSLGNFFFDDVTILLKKIESYSLGMRKKIALCASVMHKPKVLILDEPFSGLDAEGIERVKDFLELYRSNENILIIASHNLNYMQDLLSRVVVLDQGSIKFDGTISEFTQNGSRVLDEALFDYIAHTKKDVDVLGWIKE